MIAARPTTKVEFVAHRLCTAAGHDWSRLEDRYSIKWANEACFKWWIELAEHAIAAAEEFDAER